MGNIVYSTFICLLMYTSYYTGFNAFLVSLLSHPPPYGYSSDSLFK